LLSACGKDVCLLGMGDCDRMFQGMKTTTESPSTGGGLALTANPVSILVGASSTIRASGGLEPYFFKEIDGELTSTTSDRTGVFEGRVAGYAIIRVVDSRGKKGVIAVEVRRP